MAAQSKYTPERAEGIVECLKIGNTRRAAALSNGVSEDTLARWLVRYAAFADAVKRAEAEAEAEMVKLVRAAAPDSWQAAAWYLERKQPRDWGRKDTVRFDRMKDDELLDYILGGSREDGSGPPESSGDREAARVDSDC